MAFDETQQSLGHELKVQTGALSEAHNEISQRATRPKGALHTLAKELKYEPYEIDLVLLSGIVTTTTLTEMVERQFVSRKRIQQYSWKISCSPG